jgi:hypothetical protein
MIVFHRPPNRPRAETPPTLGEDPMIAKELQKALSEETEHEPELPWWARLGTIERALAIKAEVEGQIASYKEENREFRQALARLGFAGLHE